MLHSNENIYFSLESLVRIRSWKSSSALIFRQDCILTIPYEWESSLSWKCLSEEISPACLITICPFGFANNSTLYVSHEHRVKVSNEHLKVICWFLSLSPALPKNSKNFFLLEWKGIPIRLCSIYHTWALK